VGAGGPGSEHELVEERIAWERQLGAAGWIGIGWPVSDGGRELPWGQQVIFHEEYARAGGPGRVGHIGEQLLGPTLLMFGSDAQKKRFLPGILDGTSLWCQGYSEPDAGSDLAGLRTRADRGEDWQWRVNGQKVWTSLAQFADWCFVLARTSSEETRHRGLSCLLVPMRQDGVTVRPIGFAREFDSVLSSARGRRRTAWTSRRRTSQDAGAVRAGAGDVPGAAASVC
jgi:alkylation response protein AidB-like acyl-CoA dehydrogenase